MGAHQRALERLRPAAQAILQALPVFGTIPMSGYAHALGQLAASLLAAGEIEEALALLKGDEITDEDAASYATLEELMAKNEGIEDDCKESLGMPSADDDEEIRPPPDEEDIPQDE